MAASVSNIVTTHELVLSIELERETDGRWLANIPELPGVMAYGRTKAEALRAVRSLALRVLADDTEEEGLDVDVVRFVQP
jgi:predicted RNase H-like HicB family nuclease